jgi:hypothetical protein
VGGDFRPNEAIDHILAHFSTPMKHTAGMGGVCHELVGFAFIYKNKPHTHFQKGLQSITQKTIIGAGQSTRSDV